MAVAMATPDYSCCVATSGASRGNATGECFEPGFDLVTESSGTEQDDHGDRGNDDAVLHHVLRLLLNSHQRRGCAANCSEQATRETHIQTGTSLRAGSVR